MWRTSDFGGAPLRFPRPDSHPNWQFAANGGYYKSPVIHWQYTANAAVFYSFLQHYNVKFSIYNLTNRRNLTNDIPFYGNDFITRQPPRSYDLSVTAKF
jgi:outer membrane receptor protein involved in Fe transport